MTVSVEVDGHICILDDEDAHLVEGAKLHLVRFRSRFANSPGHVAVRRNGPKWVYLHRLIVGTLPGMVTDHIDGDTLNNRRSNLRGCTRSQNAANSRMKGNNPCGLKGVAEDKRNNVPTWSARLTKDGKKLYLGSFRTPEEAHAAYCAAAIKYHGEFARFA